MSSLKKISGYPENAVNWAMEKLSTEERSNLQQTLSKLEQFLGEKPKKTTTSRRLPSNAELFEKHVLLIIKDGVKKLEKLSEHIYDVNVNFNLRTAFNTMSLEDLADAHKKVVEMEKGIQIIENVYKFYRGLLYVAAHDMCDENQFLQWIEMQNVSKTTVYRYMAFCTLIMRFPRLIICDLNLANFSSIKNELSPLWVERATINWPIS